LYYQSHQSGIETSLWAFNTFTDSFYQSHQSGIETIIPRMTQLMSSHYQSHQSGIETDQQLLEHGLADATNRTNLELKLGLLKNKPPAPKLPIAPIWN